VVGKEMKKRLVKTQAAETTVPLGRGEWGHWQGHAKGEEAGLKEHGASVWELSRQGNE